MVAAKHAVTQEPATETRSCLECGGTMRFRAGSFPIEYAERSRPLEVRTWWCESCGESLLQGETLIAVDRAFAELKAEVERVLGPAEVKTIRTRLGLSQRKAGELLGGGPRAFQKYESGSTAVSVPMSNLLRLLAGDPDRLQELEPKGKR